MLALPRDDVHASRVPDVAHPCVLLVEDDPHCRRALQRLLRQHGYAVHLAGDGREALLALVRHEVDLVLTDLVMPRMDGAELLLRLADERPGLPVVAMTGASSAVQRLASAAEFGACGVLTKPFEATDLLDSLRAALGRRSA